MCVTCIADALGMTHSAISHQLRLLRATNLVKFTKDGKEVIYSLDDSHVLSLFDQALDHVKHKGFIMLIGAVKAPFFFMPLKAHLSIDG